MKFGLAVLALFIALSPAHALEEGTAKIEGKPAKTEVEAKASWQKACLAWRTTMRDKHKGVKVFRAECGDVACSDSAGTKVCTSKGVYKLSYH